MTGSDVMVPPEWWERARDGFRGRVAGAIARRPVLGRMLGRVRVWGLWAALVLVIVLLAVAERYRVSIRVYLYCFWALILWFAVSRTKTVRWSSVARMFSFGAAWAVAIAWISFRLIDAIGLTADASGPGTAIAGITEESLKLVPLLVVAVLAPGRVRRFSATDWLLLGFASGLGFQAWEEVLRRLNASINASSPGLLDILAGTTTNGPGSGYPQYGIGLLSGGSGAWRSDGSVWGYAGHHVFTALITAAIGLGIALWRQGSSSRAGSALAARVGAVLLPVLVWFLCVCDHVSYNSALNDPTWVDAGSVSTPSLIRTTWKLTGQGTGKGWLLLLLLVLCLLVDGLRLWRAGAWTELPEPLPPGPGPLAGSAPIGYPVAGVPPQVPLVGYPSAGPPIGYPPPGHPSSGQPPPGSAPSGPVRVVPSAKRIPPHAQPWWSRPNEVVAWQLATRFPAATGWWRTLLTAVIALGVHVARDLVFVVRAHAPMPGEPRRTALRSGRAAGTLIRETRAAAIAHVATEPGQSTAADPVALEVRRRRRARLVALAGLLLALLAGTVLAATVAKQIGTDLTPPASASDLHSWLAGQFDSLADWWGQRSFGEKLLIGFGLAALLTLSGGSFAFAMGASGILTYGLEHGHGVADLIRDPGAATRNYLDTTSPTEMLLDGAEFLLTFVPAGAGSKTGLLAREFAEDPAAMVARQRQIMESAGSRVRRAFDPDTYRRNLKVDTWTPEARQQWVDDLYTNGETRPAVYGKPDDIAYQQRHTGPVEPKLTTSDGSTKIWADGVKVDPDKVAAVEVKFVRNPGRSSIYEGRAPDFVSEGALDEFDQEILRYGEVMADQANPIGRLRLITSTQDAAEFLGARARSLLGPNVDIVVVVSP